MMLYASLVAFYIDESPRGAIGYIAPVDRLNGKAEEVFKARDQKLEAARAARKFQRQALMLAAVAICNFSVTDLAVGHIQF